MKWTWWLEVRELQVWLRNLSMTTRGTKWVATIHYQNCWCKTKWKLWLRMIIALLGQGEDSWALVCRDLILELQTWYSLYVDMSSSKQSIMELMIFLYVESGPIAPVEKWMIIYDMGYVIVSRYNVVLIHLSKLQSWTFFFVQVVAQ